MHQHNQLAVICRETSVVVHHVTSCHNLSSRSCGSGKGDPDPASVSARSVLTGIPRRERPLLLSRISFSFPILDPSAQIFVNPSFRVAVKSPIQLMLPIPHCVLLNSDPYPV